MRVIKLIKNKILYDLDSIQYLFLAIMFLCIGTGGFDCGSNALINMMLGPKISRPYTQSLHTCVALGFAAGMLQFLFDAGSCF